MTWQSEDLAASVRRVAIAAGFADIGFCSAQPFEVWGQASAVNPRRLLPDAQAIIVAVRPYGVFAPWPEGTAAIANYYVHSTAGHSAAMQIAAWLREQGYAALPNPALPAKQAAIRAGLGFQGLNTQFCHNELGLTVSLQLILTNTPLPYDDFPYERCEVCGVCAAACPTGAISEDGFDRDRCLRQHMLSSGAIPLELRQKMGRRLIGCTDCQDACQHARPAREAIPADLLAACSLDNLLRRDRQSIATIARYTGHNYGRPLRLCRQAAIAAGNSDDRRYVPQLAALLGDEDIILRRHAAWSLGQLGGEEARAALLAALAREPVDAVRAELAAALTSLS